MLKLLPLLLLFSFQSVIAQKAKKTAQKAEKQMLADLKAHVSYLADDRLEGRRTGTPGEKLAYTYIAEQFKNAALIPKGDNNSYIQEFEIKEGKQIDPSTHLIIKGNDLVIEKDFFPLIYSANASLKSVPTMAFQERSQPWFVDLKEMLEANKNNPHFDINESIIQKANTVTSKGGTALILYNSSSIADGLKFEAKQKVTPLTIPVIYVANTAREKYLKDETAPLEMQLKIKITENNRWGHNVIGYVDNHAPTTIILGAHYDHLGYGEDHNSLWTGERSIHNGADDNASGTGAVIMLSKMLRDSKFKGNNYLFITFSGEELGLFGSKYFTENPTIKLSEVSYMINMDMVGRLNDSTHAITIGGYGTSPAWSSILTTKEKALTVKFDSSGVGPSDHTSFYRKDIPVLFFFTGTHPDYHKPGDDVEKINFRGELQIIKYIYTIVGNADQSGKLAFAKTREPVMGGSSRFTVSLGIMPDYTFSGTGVRADGIVDGKLAQKVGIKAGDIIESLGEHSFSDVTSYMQVLSKFKKGDSTKVKVKRGSEEIFFDVTF